MCCAQTAAPEGAKKIVGENECGFNAVYKAHWSNTPGHRERCGGLFIEFEFVLVRFGEAKTFQKLKCLVLFGMYFLRPYFRASLVRFSMKSMAKSVWNSDRFFRSR